MLVINYNGNKPTTDVFKYSVLGNNNADVVRFCLSKQQGNIDLEGYKVYAQAYCEEDDFIDKVEITDNVSIVENQLQADWTLLRKHTVNRQLKVSLSFEDEDNEVVWQTQLVRINICDGINADEEIINSYPTIIEEMQQDIEELKKQDGGGSSEVKIKRVWLSYDKALKMICRADILGIYDETHGINCLNDSTKIFVNFETTPISSAIRSEIKKGTFIIRLDYPIESKGGVFDNLNGAVVKATTRDYGIGVRRYTHTMDADVLSPKKRSILVDTMIYINENDIKVNRYGEEYIHKKISLYDYINRICRFYHDDDLLIQLLPITLEEVNDYSRGRDMFDDELDYKFSIGIPTLNEHTSSNFGNKYSGNAGAKLYLGNNLTRHSGMIYEHCNYNNLKKFNLAFNCYTIFNLKGNYDYDETLICYSPYFNNKHNHCLYINGEHYKARAYGSGNALLGKKAKLQFMVAKPRCAILSENWQTDKYAFVKTYPQSEQQIKVACKAMKDVNEGDYWFLPIFRIGITPR